VAIRAAKQEEGYLPEVLTRFTQGVVFGSYTYSPFSCTVGGGPYGDIGYSWALTGVGIHIVLVNPNPSRVEVVLLADFSGPRARGSSTATRYSSYRGTCL